MSPVSSMFNYSVLQNTATLVSVLVSFCFVRLSEYGGGLFKAKELVILVNI